MRPRFHPLPLLLLTVLVASAGPLHAAQTGTKRQPATVAYDRAQRLREALTGKAEEERTRKDYDRVLNAFRRVYYLDPSSSKADSAVREVAELLAEEGRALNDPEKTQAAIGQYEFLRHEYPGSRYRVDALFTEALLLHQSLHDDRGAREKFTEFLARSPSSHLVEQAQASLSEIAKTERAARRKGKKPKQEAQVAQDTPPTSAAEEKPVAQRSGTRVLVTGIRHWSTPDYTRIAIDLADEVKFEAGRVPNPDRVFFDLHNARLAPELVGKSFDVSDGLLRKVRVAPYEMKTVRIVLDVDDLSEYSAFLLPNPYRLIIDIHGKRNALQRAQSGAPADSPVGKTASKPDELVVVANDAENSPSEIAKLSQAPSQQKATEKPTTNPVVEKVAPRADTTRRTQTTTPRFEWPEEAQVGAASVTAAKDKHSKITDLDEDDSSSGVRAKSSHTTKRGKASAPAAEVQAAQPNSAGERSLIRALGLKINRIVVDAGHGGHDTGTIGPNGLQEKDLVLDVALRLGTLLETKLRSELVYTRDDDTFVPLETRTAIANKEQADLFISVHANSSPDASARGIETYYLNFTSSPDALEVAARENAVSEKSIHELQDLVKKIALKEKIEESREFASDVEMSMHDTLVPRNVGLKDRGVKKAPFIVLIGANMPSILSEISFVSNPEDERKLRTPEYRQRIAEALYRGVARYVGGLAGVKLATTQPAAPAALP